MADYDLTGSRKSIGLNGNRVVGIMPVGRLTTNETRHSYFDTRYLKEWAEALDDIYGGTVVLQHTPDKPMVAYPHDQGGEDSDARVGVGIAPRLRRSEVDGDA